MSTPKEDHLKELAAMSEALTAISGRTLDLMKHLTTLSSGVIVLLVTFRQQVAATTHWKALLPIAIASFVICILYAVVVCDRIIGIEQRVGTVYIFAKHDALKAEQKLAFSSYEKEVKDYSKSLSVGGRITSVSFSSGIILLGAFIVRNLT
jgi:hypothetical protein